MSFTTNGNVMHMTAKAEAPAPAAPKGPTQEELLIEIRDALVRR